MEVSTRADPGPDPGPNPDPHPDPHPEPLATARPQPSQAGLLGWLSSHVADGLRYWEPRRLVYNAALALVVLGHFLAAWPGSRDRLSLDLALELFFLAVLANVCYCVAYVADVFVQFSGLQKEWQTGRPILLIVGTGFAATIAHFFARGLLGS